MEASPAHMMQAWGLLSQYRIGHQSGLWCWLLQQTAGCEREGGRAGERNGRKIKEMRKERGSMRWKMLV